MANSKILSLCLALAIISLTSIQTSAMEPFERLSPKEQALERKRQARQAKIRVRNPVAKGQQKWGTPPARQATQQLPAYDPEEIRASREEFERKKRRQAEQDAEQEAEQLEAEYQAQAVQKKYSDIQPMLIPLQQGLQRLEVQMQNLMERTDKLERAPKVAIQEQPVCCIETDGCTEDQGVGPIPCKNKHNDLICNACLNQIKNATNRCPICQEQLIG